MMLARAFPVVINAVPMAINQDLKALSQRRDLRSDYLAWMLRGTASESLSRTDEAGHGTKALRMDAWLSMLLLAPPADDQEAIVAFLDRETAKIDALVEEQRRLIELLKEKRQAIISYTVTKGLDPNAPVKDSGVEWLGQVPEHWEMRKIKHLFHLVKRPFKEKVPVLSVYRAYGVIGKDSRTDNFNKTPEDLTTYQAVAPDDLVINKMKAWQGSLGVSGSCGVTSPDYVVYEPQHTQHSRFLHYFLRSARMPGVYLTISNGIRPSQWRLEPDKFEQLAIPLPPLAEQRAIATYLAGELERSDALVEEVDHAVALLQERRTALISAAVTGKIDVRGAAPAAAEAA
jgi:type I restriction enzyme S subunit